jgi:hypothetical protein
MANIDNIFEDFSLNDLLFDIGNGFDFPPFDESDVELHDEHVKVDEETNLDLFCLSHPHSIVSSMKWENILLKHPAKVKVNPNTIMTLDANFLRHEEGTPLELFHQDVLKK